MRSCFFIPAAPSTPSSRAMAVRAWMFISLRSDRSRALREGAVAVGLLGRLLLRRLLLFRFPACRSPLVLRPRRLVRRRGLAHRAPQRVDPGPVLGADRDHVPRRRARCPRAAPSPAAPARRGPACPPWWPPARTAGRSGRATPAASRRPPTARGASPRGTGTGPAARGPSGTRSRSAPSPRAPPPGPARIRSREGRPGTSRCRRGRSSRSGCGPAAPRPSPALRLPARAFSRLLLPTLDRPRNAISGSPSGGTARGGPRCPRTSPWAVSGPASVRQAVAHVADLGRTAPPTPGPRRRRAAPARSSAPRPRSPPAPPSSRPARSSGCPPGPSRSRAAG